MQRNFKFHSHKHLGFPYTKNWHLNKKNVSISIMVNDGSLKRSSQIHTYTANLKYPPRLWFSSWTSYYLFSIHSLISSSPSPSLLHLWLLTLFLLLVFELELFQWTWLGCFSGFWLYGLPVVEIPCYSFRIKKKKGKRNKCKPSHRSSGSHPSCSIKSI